MTLVTISNPSSSTDPLVDMDNQSVRRSVQFYGEVRVENQLPDQPSLSATLTDPLLSQTEKEKLLGLIGLIGQEDE